MSANWSLNWTTKNELDFIDDLVTGKCFPRDRKPRTTPEKRLENYIRSATRRLLSDTFGSVDGPVAIRHAKQLLSKISDE